MSTGHTFLSLRQNSKRRSIDDVGSVRVHKKWNDRNYKSRKYRKHRETENKIDVNIIHIIIIVFNDNFDPELSFWLTNLKSDFTIL